MWAILIVAFVQMPGLALTPGINQIRTTAFSNYSLGMVQTALALASLTQPLAAFFAAFLINRGIVSKKAVIIFGLCLLSATGVTAIILHTEFRHLILLSVLLGASTGLFISNMFGLIFDYFEPQEREFITGYQSSVINAGGITMGLVGGLLATFIWYGGYLVLLVGLPTVVLVYFTVPKHKNPAIRSGNKAPGKKLNPKIYYYCAIAFLFMMTYSACGSNLSTHIASIGNSATSGIAVAFQMSGGVVSGIFFDKLSRKFGDYSLSIGLCAVFIGYTILSFFQGSLVMTFVAVFIAGISLSIMLPRCIYMVSTLVDNPATSATATALITIASPSMGSFMSPIIITNVTTALFGESTVARYRSTGIFVLALAVVLAVVTTLDKREQNKRLPHRH